MAARDFKPSTFDIYCRRSGRWKLHSCFLNEEGEEALAAAKKIDQDGGFDGVRLMTTKFGGSGRGAVEVLVWSSPKLERELFKPKASRRKILPKPEPADERDLPQPVRRAAVSRPRAPARHPAPKPPEKQGPDIQGTVTILFTDIVGSTRMTQERGDQGAQKVLHVHNSLVRAALAKYGGREVKHTGDGIMAVFGRATGAIEAARKIQFDVARHNAASDKTPFEIRIGLNAGEPVSEDGDFFGTAVQIAARVCDKARATQILATEAVKGLTAGHGVTMAPGGRFALKGIEGEVTLYDVEWGKS